MRSHFLIPYFSWNINSPVITHKSTHLFSWKLIILMASFFKECPHPDDKQRKELSRELGLEPLQVKFWFQNKRTQMKVIILLFNLTLFISDDFSGEF